MSSSHLVVELLECAKQTSPSKNKSRSLECISQICVALAQEILSETYKPDGYIRFAVTDPKLREIYAPSYRDRLAQTWLVSRLLPGVEKTLIEDSYSNRVNKGTLAAVHRVQHFMRQSGHKYYLQLDIQNYFNSIHLPTLRLLCDTLMQRYLKNHPRYFQLKFMLNIQLETNITRTPCITSGDEKLLAALPFHKILQNSPPDTGLPLGSAASQTLANLYLNPLDHFIKHRLRIKGYTRYMDDLFILGESPQQLSDIRTQIDQFVSNKLRLTLHPTKQRIQKCSQGADYLGYIVYPHYLHMRKRNIRKLYRWLAIFNACFAPDIHVSPDIIPHDWRSLLTHAPVLPTLPLIKKIQSIINSYLGAMSHATHWRLRRHIYHRKMFHLKTYFLPAPGYKAVRIKKHITAECFRRRHGQ